MKLGEYMRQFRFPFYGVSVSLYDIHNGRIGYRMRWRGRTIFEGVDFGPSPLYAIDSRDTALALMGFLCLREGDVEAEYFDNYTPVQLEWRGSADCMNLGEEMENNYGESDD